MDRRQYTLRHVKKCFPSIGSSTLQYWADQGYLAFGSEEHGARDYMVFSWPELVHVGVILQLSVWGAFRRGSRILLISGRDATGSDTLDNAIRPDALINQYYQSRFRTAVIIYSWPKKREKGDPRTADANLLFSIVFTSPDDAKFYFESLFFSRSKHNTLGPGLGFVNVHNLALHVCQTLNIEFPADYAGAGSPLRE